MVLEYSTSGNIIFQLSLIVLFGLCEENDEFQINVERYVRQITPALLMMSLEEGPLPCDLVQDKVAQISMQPPREASLRLALIEL